MVISTNLAAQHADNINVTKREFDDRIEIYATNKNPIPVSVAFDFKTVGLVVETVNTQYHIIYSNRPAVLVATLTKKPNQSWSYKYNMQVYLGNLYSSGHDTSYIYTLPFEKGEAYHLSQGYNGTFSHHNEHAIDFVMPEGTRVSAMREGVVAEVIEHNKTGCPHQSCLRMANSVLIYHEDGTFARYSHLKFKGAKVAVGDEVEVGDIIGLSGNTGWSSEPHLHFTIFEIAEGNITYSIPTKFFTQDGEAYLEENRSYRRIE